MSPSQLTRGLDFHPVDHLVSEWEREAGNFCAREDLHVLVAVAQ